MNGYKADWPWIANKLPPDGYIEQIITGNGPEGGTVNFYNIYAAAKNKPFVISESGAAFHLNYTQTGSAAVTVIDPGPGRAAIQSAYYNTFLFNTTFLNTYPLFKMVNMFEFTKTETESQYLVQRDFRATSDAASLADFKQSVAQLQAAGKLHSANTVSISQGTGTGSSSATGTSKASPSGAGRNAPSTGGIAAVVGVLGAAAIAYIAVDLILRRESDAAAATAATAAATATDPTESSCAAQKSSARVALADTAADVELCCINAELHDSVATTFWYFAQLQSSQARRHAGGQAQADCSRLTAPLVAAAQPAAAAISSIAVALLFAAVAAPVAALAPLEPADGTVILGGWLDTSNTPTGHDSPASFDSRLGIRAGAFELAQNIPVTVAPSPPYPNNTLLYANLTDLSEHTDATVFLTVCECFVRKAGESGSVTVKDR
ncbi:hypothetical protein HK405_003201 [Cladochytrium tenue]|nr:hypothetical protein HK405_003201 [Cladochytrium tenue]